MYYGFPWSQMGIKLEDIFLPKERTEILEIFAEYIELNPSEVAQLLEEIPNTQPHLDFFVKIQFLEKLTDGTYQLRVEDPFVWNIKHFFDLLVKADADSNTLQEDT